MADFRTYPAPSRDLAQHAGAQALTTPSPPVLGGPPQVPPMGQPMGPGAMGMGMGGAMGGGMGMDPSMSQAGVTPNPSPP